MNPNNDNNFLFLLMISAYLIYQSNPPPYLPYTIMPTGILPTALLL